MSEEESVSSWLDKAFLEEVLSADASSAVSVTAFHVSKAVGKGDNYASLLLRVGIEYRQGDNAKKCSLIVKSLPAGDFLQTFIINIDAFAKEESMYQETLPAMSRLLKEKALEETPVTIGTRALSCTRPYTLVLEDLKQHGFRMADRHDRLDLEHTLLVLKYLGTFHGSSVALYIEDPDCMKHYYEALYTESQRETMGKVMAPTFNALADIVEAWPGYEKYGDKMREVGKTVMDSLVDVVKPKEGDLSVLNHGDCWVNNFLFRYSDESGEVEDVRFVDFQLARFSSPALDLLYFMYTSVHEEVRVGHLEDMLETYHSSLGNTLRAAGCGDRLMSLEELKRDLDCRAMFGMVTAFTTLSVVLAEPSEALDLAEFTEESLNQGDINPLKKAYEGKRYRAALQKLLPHFETKGIL